MFADIDPSRKKFLLMLLGVMVVIAIVFAAVFSWLEWSRVPGEPLPPLLGEEEVLTPEQIRQREEKAREEKREEAKQELQTEFERLQKIVEESMAASNVATKDPEILREEQRQELDLLFQSAREQQGDQAAAQTIPEMTDEVRASQAEDLRKIFDAAYTN